MAKVKIDCTVYKLKMNGTSGKKYFAKFPKTRGIVKSHERTDDALVLSLSCIKTIPLFTGKNGEKAERIKKKVTCPFAIKYDGLAEEKPFQLHGRMVSIYPDKIVIEE
jgi:hypothetical protein